jgi:phosphoribosyl 1,2-cyclic phosphodiesterase
VELTPERGVGSLAFTPVLLPHDCDPTVAFRLEHGERRAVILTDLGRPRPELARELRGAHLLLLEFNYDPEMMRSGPYPPVLQRRITGGRGHLSNGQAARMLELLAGPELHTLVLGHLSQKNNRPELALEAARATLDRLGLGHVRTIVAEQDAIGENLAV